MSFCMFCCQQAEVPEDSDDDEDPADEVFGFISMLNLTERKVGTVRCYVIYLGWQVA